MRRSKWVLRIVVMGVLLIMTLALLESSLQLIGSPPIETDHQWLFVEHDASRGWRNIPNAEGDYVTAEYSVRLQYNARGIRGPERSYAKPPGTYRIVVLGDSFIEGSSVAQEDRVTEKLEKLLNATQSSWRAEVIALGTGGYSTDQELLWLEGEGLRYQPDLIVLMFYFNDVWYNIQSQSWRGAKPLFVMEGETLRVANVPIPAARPSGFARFKAWCKARSRLYALSLGVRSWLYEAMIKVGLTSPSPPPELAVYRKTVTPEVTHAWYMTRALLQRMQQVAEASGASFLAFHIPFRAGIYPLDWAAFRVRYGLAAEDWDLDEVSWNFMAACRESIICLEPTARFVERAQILGKNAERLYYHEGDLWNANGHALAAELLAEYVLANSLAPKR
jgi:lysophospholipase L1-like esterase